MIINYLTDTSFEIISTWEAVEEKKPKVKRKRKSTSRKMTMNQFYKLLSKTKYIVKDGKVIHQSEDNKTAEPRLLTWQEMQNYPVLQKMESSVGEVIYRPRSEKGKNMIYKIDSILAGLNENQIKRKRCIIVDTEDMIISNSFE